MNYIDTHSHLYDEAFSEDREEALARATEAGVSMLLMPDIDRTSRPQMIALAEQHPDRCKMMLGLHPTSVGENFREEMETMETLLDRYPIVGIGECGLDFYWDTTFYEEQCTVFRRQMAIAREMRLPLVIHSRKAIQTFFEIFKKEKLSEISGVFHCFEGGIEEAKKAVDYGLYLGVGGVSTYKNSHLAEVIRRMGLSRVILETDSPYLSPVPHRGSRNESSYIPLIAQHLATLLNITEAKVAETTTLNAKTLFPL